MTKIMSDDELQNICVSIQAKTRYGDDEWEAKYGNKDGLYGFIKSQRQAWGEQRETELLDALYWMYTQYCSRQGHSFMGAGETASDILEEAGYITVDTIGVVVRDNGDSNEQRSRNNQESKS